ncbi:MAG: hypothetical protein IK012_10865 [Fibrobacter sp.]|uniref:hypothetical protein n=1 Tax=Fibrobacter sp. TaxID=35828 RepID=UPI0025C31E17|nr:hypothetical protein [Fibrobacter sp.]MBR4785733.1 hypothetical protein [Fibrobacter sp.]
MKKIFLATLAMSVAFALTGCKGANEKRGDEHLENQRYRNAINSYLDALKKGKVSDEFYDNFTLALVRGANVEAKSNLNSDLISGYFDKAASNISKVQKPEVIEEFVTSYATIGKQQAAQQGLDYGSTLQAFAKIDTALSIAKRMNAGEAAVKTLRTEAENLYVPAALAEANDETDPVVCEYYLLRIAEIAPENADVKAALNKSRKGTRGYFLIFGENIPDPSGKNRVDKWGYVMALPTLKLTATSLVGELQFWASTGNNTVLDPANITLVSTDGKSVNAKAGTGWCEAEVLVGKKGDEKIEKKRQNLKAGEKGKLMNEFQCGLNVTFNFDKSFVPDYIQYKDEFGIGKKFLGQ